MDITMDEQRRLMAASAGKAFSENVQRLVEENTTEDERLFIDALVKVNGPFRFTIIPGDFL